MFKNINRIMCSCKGEIVLGVDTDEWGPVFWRTLHSLSLLAGKAQPRAQDEETRTWIKVLTFTGLSIPCPDCRAHYKEWILTRQPKLLLSIPYSERGEWVRHWLYDIHTDINLRLGKVNLSFDDLEVTFKEVNVFREIATIEKYILRASRANQVKLTDFLSWKNYCVILKSLYY
jgi:hypothetical protein